MILIIGGVFQGKTDFAKNLTGIENVVKASEIKNVSEKNPLIITGVSDYIKELIQIKEELQNKEKMQSNEEIHDKDILQNTQKLQTNTKKSSDIDILDRIKSEFDVLINLYEPNKKGLVVICDEVGSGVVPMRREDREFREIAGRLSTFIAGKSDEVYRVCCGIGVKIK